MKRMIDDELLTADKNGITVGKNLEVDGTTKLSGGLEVLHTYNFNDNISTKLEVLLERHNHFSSTWNEYIGYGYISQFGTRHPCIFSYSTNNGAIETFSAVSEYKLYTLENKQVASYNIAKAEQCQPKLYRHVLNLSNSNQMYAGYIVYISTSNLKVDNLEKLTTLLHPSSNYIYPLTGTCTGLDTRDAIQFGSKNLYLKSFDKISYENNTWYFKDNYGDTEAFDTVSDTVSAL